MFSCGLDLGVAAVQLAVADDALRLGADVDEDLVLVDAHDGALDDVAVLEAADLAGLLVEQLFHRRRLGAVVDARRRRATPASAGGASAKSDSRRRGGDRRLRLRRAVLRLGGMPLPRAASASALCLGVGADASARSSAAPTRPRRARLRRRLAAMSASASAAAAARLARVGGRLNRQPRRLRWMCRSTTPSSAAAVASVVVSSADAGWGSALAIGWVGSASAVSAAMGSVPSMSSTVNFCVSSDRVSREKQQDPSYRSGLARWLCRPCPGGLE